MIHLRNAANRLNVGHLLAGVLLSISASLVQAAPAWSCAQQRTVAADAVLDLPLASAPDRFSMLEEQGGDLEYSADGVSWRAVSFPGPRLGFVPLRSSAAGSQKWWLRPAASSAAHAAMLGTDCQWTEPTFAEWFERADALAQRVDSSAAANNFVLSDFDTLLNAAGHPLLRTGALHLRAGARYRISDYAGSAQDYAQAALQWSAMGETERAGAAWLGQADLLRLMARFPESRAVSVQALAVLDGPKTQYLHARARENICHAHHYANELDLAASCLDALIARYLQLHEVDGAFNAAVLLLAVRRDQGVPLDPAQLDPALKNALQSPQVDVMRKGRLQLQMAMAMRDQGDIGAALHGFDGALEYFLQAGEERERWLANTLLQVADLYAELGMFTQAYTAHRDAMLTFAPASAPARVGAALKVLAEIDRRSGHARRGLAWTDRAANLYARLDVPAERAIVALMQLELSADLEVHDASAMDRLQALRTDLPAQYSTRAQLLEFRLADRRADDTQQANDYLALRKPPVSLAIQHEATLRQLQSLNAQGDVIAARALLQDQIQRSHALAQAIDKPAMAYLTTHSMRHLRSAIPALMLGHDLAGSERDDWWRAIAMSQPLSAYRANASDEVSDRAFSAQLSRTLLTGSGLWNAQSERVLLRRLGSSRRQASLQRIPDFDQVQSSLAPGELLLIVVAAEPKSLLWIISANTEQSFAIAGADILQGKVSRLLKQLVTRGVDAHALDQSIDDVSQSVFGALGDHEAPHRLLIFADESLAGIPWSALHWPGASQPLVETSSISLLSRITYSEPGIAVASKPDVAILVADPQRSGMQRLAPLVNANSEVLSVQRILDRTGVAHQATWSVGPEQLQQSLVKPGAMVHLAAHGFAQPGMLGYAGVWLAPEQGSDRAQFLSWLDLADRPLHAGLVVLNACQLAATSATAQSGSLSFAGAVSAVGVKQVVAALWAASDAATAVWVPEFYRELDIRELSSSAEALRKAQNALRRSRQFRHPFYWASLIHLTQLEVRVPVAASSREGVALVVPD